LGVLFGGMEIEYGQSSEGWKIVAKHLCCSGITFFDTTFGVNNKDCDRRILKITPERLLTCSDGCFGGRTPDRERRFRGVYHRPRVLIEKY
jgi:hypothetical protein